MSGQIVIQREKRQNISALPPDKQRKRLLTQILILLTVSCGAALTGLVFDEQVQNFLPEGRPLISAYNHKPSGTSGFMEVAKRAGLTCHVWIYPYRQLDTIKGVLVIISPINLIEEFEAKQILKWVAQGNELVYLDDFEYEITRRLLKPLHVGAAEIIPPINEQAIPVDDPSPVFDHVPSLTVSTSNYLTRGTGHALLKDKDGKPLLISIKHGKGSILIGTVPTLVSNERFDSEKSWPNFQFLVNWLSSAGGQVWFDERCHGYSKNTNVFLFLAQGAAGPTVLQILLLLLVGVLSTAQRFGRADVVENKRKISNLEFIYGLSNTFRLARANTATLEIVGQLLRSKICKLLAINPHESDETLMQVWGSSTLFSDSLKKTVSEFFGDYRTAVGAKNLPDNELKSLVIRCDKISETLNSVVNNHAGSKHAEQPDQGQ